MIDRCLRLVICYRRQRHVVVLYAHYPSLCGRAAIFLIVLPVAQRRLPMDNILFVDRLGTVSLLTHLVLDLLQLNVVDFWLLLE